MKEQPEPVRLIEEVQVMETAGPLRVPLLDTEVK
jgi:hypothetical protein